MPGGAEIHLTTVARFAALYGTACEITRCGWPYECGAKRANPDHDVFRCAGHGVWWHTALPGAVVASLAGIHDDGVPVTALRRRLDLAPGDIIRGAGVWAAVTMVRHDWVTRVTIAETSDAAGITGAWCLRDGDTVPVMPRARLST